MRVDHDVDAVLAVLVDDLYEQVHDLRMVVGFLMERTNLRPPTGDDVKRVKRGRPSADQELWRWLYRRLYSDGSAPLPPFPLTGSPTRPPGTARSPKWPDHARTRQTGSRTPRGPSVTASS